MDLLERNRRFWTRESTDRPLLAVKVGTFAADSFRFPFESGVLKPSDIQVEAFLEDYDRLHKLSGRLNEDLLMVALPYWGIPWMEAIIGCPIQVDSQTASMWTTPREDELEPHDMFPHPDNPWIARMLEFTDALVRRAAGAYPVSLTLMRGPLDMVSALVGHDRMCTMVMDEPARMRSMIEACTEVWLRVAQLQWSRIPAYAGGYCCGMRRVWAPGSTALSQEDASVLISPRTYKDIVLESHRRILESFDYSMLHLHSAGLHIVEPLLGLSSLRALEVDIDPGGPAVNDLLPAFRRVQEVTSLHIYGVLSFPDIELILDKLSPRGLCLEVKVATEEQGRDLLDKIHLKLGTAERFGVAVGDPMGRTINKED